MAEGDFTHPKHLRLLSAPLFAATIRVFQPERTASRPLRDVHPSHADLPGGVVHLAEPVAVGHHPMRVACLGQQAFPVAQDFHVLLAAADVEEQNVAHDALDAHPPARAVLGVDETDHLADGHLDLGVDAKGAAPTRVAQAEKWVTEWVSRHVVATCYGLLRDLSATCTPRFGPQKAI